MHLFSSYSSFLCRCPKATTQLGRARVEDCSSSDPVAMVDEDTTTCGGDSPISCKPREPIVLETTASSFQSTPASHLPTHPPPSLTPSLPMALAYPALQLFYLLPGTQQGSPPALLPVYSSLTQGQPLFLPALNCGAVQETLLEATGPSPKNFSEGRLSKAEPYAGSHVRSEKSRGGFFRPWESVTVELKSKPSKAGCPKFRPWEEASSHTSLQ